MIFSTDHAYNEKEVCVRLNNITFTGILISVSGIWTNFVKGSDWLSFQDGCQMLMKDEKKFVVQSLPDFIRIHLLN